MKMQIDKEKLKQLSFYHEYSGEYVINLDDINEAEIHQYVCLDCSFHDETENDEYPCNKCKHNYSEMFKQKEYDLNKLFLGAPIMVMLREEGWDLQPYSKITERPVDVLKLRLPTVEEAPKNTWLIPWPKAPK